MRLWSIHPQYLDAKGLVAAWREGLLAQAVLAGETRGYKNHPQLVRFKNTKRPETCIAAYLQAIFSEASSRGYRFNGQKIGNCASVESLLVTTGQLQHEWSHFTSKLELRAPCWLSQLDTVTIPEAHPLFQIVRGPVAEWEVVSARQGTEVNDG